MREVGTLLIAFAPLDVALSEGRFSSASAFRCLEAPLRWKGNVTVSVDAIVGFGGVALLGLLGFPYAWFSTPGKSRSRGPSQGNARGR